MTASVDYYKRPYPPNSSNSDLFSSKSMVTLQELPLILPPMLQPTYLTSLQPLIYALTNEELLTVEAIQNLHLDLVNVPFESLTVDDPRLVGSISALLEKMTPSTEADSVARAILPKLSRYNIATLLFKEFCQRRHDDSQSGFYRSDLCVRILRCISYYSQDYVECSGQLIMVSYLYMDVIYSSSYKSFEFADGLLKEARSLANLISNGTHKAQRIDQTEEAIKNLVRLKAARDSSCLIFKSTELLALSRLYGQRASPIEEDVLSETTLAIPLLKESLDNTRAIEDPTKKISIFVEISHVFELIGLEEERDTLLQEALTLATQDDHLLEILCNHYCYSLNNPETAAEIIKKSANLLAISLKLQEISKTCHKNPDLADRLLTEAVAIIESPGYLAHKPLSKAIQLRQISNIYATLKYTDEALSLLHKALALTRSVSIPSQGSLEAIPLASELTHIGDSFKNLAIFFKKDKSRYTGLIRLGKTIEEEGEYLLGSN